MAGCRRKACAWRSTKSTKTAAFQVAGKNYKLQLLNPDTQGNPQQALIELKKMLEQENVKYVFGPFLTNVYKGIEPYAKGNNGKFLMIGGCHRHALRSRQAGP